MYRPSLAVILLYFIFFLILIKVFRSLFVVLHLSIAWLFLLSDKLESCGWRLTNGAGSCKGPVTNGLVVAVSQEPTVGISALCSDWL